MPENIPPYNEGILKVLQWGVDNEIALQKIPSDNNWCQSGYKCYYGGVIPMQMDAKEVIHNFISSGLQNVKVNENPNKPTVTKVISDSFFIIIMDVKKENEVLPHFFFYDGKEAVKNVNKRSWPIKEFSLENVGEFRKPWEKINKIQMDMYIKELANIFNNFIVKVQSKQNNEIKQHENNCECDHCHDTSDPAGNS